MDGIKTDGPEHTPRTAVQRSNLDDKAKARLEKATREFEALFLSYMLKTMRGNQSEENGLFGDNFGGDLMTGMFDQELARHVTRGNSLGLGEMMYRSLTGEKYHQADRSTTKSATAVPQRPETAPVVRERKLRTAAPVPVPEIQSPGTTSPETPEEKPQPAPHATPELRTNPPVMAVPDSVQARVRVFNALIEEASVTHGVDSSLVRAIMASESGGRPDARSSKSAKGLMQLIDSTAAEMGVQSIWDPKQNISGGVKYLKQQLDRFEGDVALAAAAYNAGPGAVRKHGGVPPYRETQQYVRRVLNYLSYFQGQEVSGDDND